MLRIIIQINIYVNQNFIVYLLSAAFFCVIFEAREVLGTLILA